MGEIDNPTKTYAIRGIPLPPDVVTKTKTIPYAPGTPSRLDISKFFPPENDFLGRQWTLLVLALERFKAMKVDERLSYFQVAGIHAYPLQSWDGAPPPHPDPTRHVPDGADPYGGYCNHNTVAFPTWHRPYMLLFEQLIWEHMKVIIKEWKLEGTQLADWEKAAEQWRLPYWDWARKQTYSDKYSLPYVLTVDRVAIYPPNGDTLVVDNPFWGFENPQKHDDGKPRKFNDMPKTPVDMTKWNINNTSSNPVSKLLPESRTWGECSGVSRYGIFTDDNGKTYRGLEGVNNFSEANVIFGNFEDHWYNPYSSKKVPDRKERFKFNPPGTLADAVNRLFSPQYSDTWGTFASTKWFAESAQDISTGYMSLEYIHNNVHNLCGGSQANKAGLGHMSDVPVAAFDPVFWLHHCNIDRLLSMWQSLNWNSWWNIPEPPNDNDNVPDVKPDAPLQPFHTSETTTPDQGFYTSNDARDWTKLRYSYDDLVPKPEAVEPNGTLNEARYKTDLAAHIRTLYPSTIEYYQKLYEDRAIENKEFFGPNNTEAMSWNDYIINVIYDRYALNGTSYVIEFWLGGADNDPNSTFSFKENFIGQVYSFGGLVPASEENPSGCANCGSQKAKKVLSRAQVPLTIPIISQALDGKYEHLNTTRGRDVVPYLEKHLHWRFVQTGGEVKPASDFPNTTISVWRGTGKPQEGTSRDGQPLPPVYAQYKPQYSPTEHKEGGLSESDELLGRAHAPEFNFRGF
ncbi:hypothetical protein B0T10DRAFT_418433 [Thelonectria olida]|uniref:tyrosinase n=1 Tax=Thelonectria olida TaxID=1576542 RepID=A0A9P8VN70_9HYPO|nr:hypothetical protein B0T10DRAFT_418433 [Thelonectria olida]